MGLLADLFHSHQWKLLSADVTGSPLAGYGACVTLECEDCGKREYRERGIGYMYTQDLFPSKNAARVWIDSILPPKSDKVKLKTIKEDHNGG